MLAEGSKFPDSQTKGTIGTFYTAFGGSLIFLSWRLYRKSKRKVSPGQEPDFLEKDVSASQYCNTRNPTIQESAKVRDKTVSEYWNSMSNKKISSFSSIYRKSSYTNRRHVYSPHPTQFCTLLKSDV